MTNLRNVAYTTQDLALRTLCSWGNRWFWYRKV